MESILQHGNRRQTLRADYDIISTIVMTCRDLPVNIQNTHVKGHQNDIAGHQLTRQETLNTISDTYATNELKAVLELKEHPQIIPFPNTIYLVEVASFSH
jgi:hypothetical protein